MRRAGMAALLAAAGCAGTVADPAPYFSGREIGEVTFERWRLIERPYGAIEEPWSLAGDGRIPGDSHALLFEPVYREPTVEAPRPLGGFSPCLHRVRLTRLGPEGLAVGEVARIRLDVEGDPGAFHVIRIEGAHAGIVILDVQGATPLGGRKGLYAVEGRSPALVRFTSRFAGRGGIEVEVLGETGSPGAPPNPDAIAQRP